MTDVQALRDARAARKAELRAKRDEQEARDLEAIDALEVEHGDDSIDASLRVKAWRAGLPFMLAARRANPNEVKRYQARVRPNKQGDAPDTAAAAIEAGKSCMVYPPRDSELRSELETLGDGIFAALGVAAINLASVEAEAEGKE